MFYNTRNYTNDFLNILLLLLLQYSERILCIIGENLFELDFKM